MTELSDGPSCKLFRLTFSVVDLSQAGDSKTNILPYSSRLFWCQCPMWRNHTVCPLPQAVSILPSNSDGPGNPKRICRCFLSKDGSGSIIVGGDLNAVTKLLGCRHFVACFHSKMANACRVIAQDHDLCLESHRTGGNVPENKQRC